MDKVFTLEQVHSNPRDGEAFTTHFDTYPTLADAKKAARTELKGARWVITETRIVARSPEEETSD